ncbi:matrixin family metalloprotease [Bacillus salitolerans]|uniref:Matrixin family metalloprotease n=1 Tax=Bacillus salitolerans TaxID=1437434 RepID=A0ABW4LXP9_9BACI
MFRLKNFYNMIGTVTVAAMLLFSINPAESHAKLQGWDLVDSGKHLDWDADTKYTSTVSSAVSIWEGYKPGIIRPDSATVVEDVYIFDYYEVSNTIAQTSSAGTMKFNDYKFQGYNSEERLHTAIHEFGHALGLDHTWGMYDVMQQGRLSINSLSNTDESSYDEAYSTY